MRKLITSLLILGFAFIGGPALALSPDPDGTYPVGQNSRLSIIDTAGVLDADALTATIAGLDFTEPTRIAVFTRSGAPEDNLNEQVLRFARDTHRQWLSPDGQTWADGLFIFAIDTTGRHVGTYFGEDRALSDSDADAVQDAARPLLQEGRWTEASSAAIERAATLMNRPWYLNPGAIIGGIVALLGVAAAALATVFALNRTRARSLAARDAGDAALQRVRTDLPQTEIHARAIPRDSRHGQLLLDRYRGFTASVDALTQQNLALHALRESDLKKKATAESCEKYADDAAELDALDDAMADANELLNLGPAWRAAWDRQLAPFAADLAALDDLLGDTPSTALASSVAALTAFRGRSSSETEQLTAQLETGSITPDRALDALADVRERLGRLLEFHANAVIAHSAKTTEEAQLMRKALLENPRGGHHNPADARRANDILGSTHPPLAYVSVVAFGSSLQHSQSALDGSRDASSGSGYGASGGGFSGSGSSSSF